jgi:hypothetical protein
MPWRLFFVNVGIAEVAPAKGNEGRFANCFHTPNLSEFVASFHRQALFRKLELPVATSGAPPPGLSGRLN